MLGIGLNVAIMLIIYFAQGGSQGSTSISQLVGIMSGAVTNTPRTPEPPNRLSFR